MMKMTVQNKDISLPLKTCLFVPGGSTWDFFGHDITDSDRERTLNWLVSNGMNAMIFLLTAYAPDCPHKMDFFENGYGKDLDLDKVKILRRYSRMFATAGAAFVPCLLCDDRSVSNLDMSIHRRAIHVLTGELNPYVPAYLIGLESTEYLSQAAHNVFYQAFKSYAPDKYIGTHCQGIVPGMDFLAWEHPWCPTEGDEHSAEETAQKGREAMQSGKTIWFCEYNVNINGSRIREQSKALLALRNCAGIGGPYR